MKNDNNEHLFKEIIYEDMSKNKEKPKKKSRFKEIFDTIVLYVALIIIIYGFFADPIFSYLSLDKSTDSIYAYHIIPIPQKKFIAKLSDVKSYGLKEHVHHGRMNYTTYSVELILENGQKPVQLDNYKESMYVSKVMDYGSKIMMFKNSDEQQSLSIPNFNFGVLFFDAAGIFLIWCLFLGIKDFLKNKRKEGINEPDLSKDEADNK